MFSIKLVTVCFLLVNCVKAALHLDPANPAFDPKLYEDALNAELCAKHLNYITRNLDLYSKFLDRGLRIPKALTEGNMIDLGSYHACLDINEKTSDDFVHGKYCMVKVPLKQFLEILTIPDKLNWAKGPLPWSNITGLSNAELQTIKEVEDHFVKSSTLFVGDTGARRQNKNDSKINTSQYSIKMGMCLPKSCTTREAMDKLYFNLSSIDFAFEEKYCRLPDDKPWTPADTVATVILSLIGLVTILSTSYDIHHCIIKKKDPKEANVCLRAFSVYTNTQRLLTFNKVPGAIECIDGIRALAMAWVILGHTFVIISLNGNITNLLDVATWFSSAKSLWLTSAPITVDTFFTLSGLLLVYTAAGKLTGVGLLKKLHVFYLSRLLRLFPILAFTVLLQISVFHRVTDGPNWQPVEYQVNFCRAYWWTNFLYVQNYVNYFEVCLQHTWYLTVDMQLHFISPFVLYWVLNGKRQQAWIALIAGVVISITASTVYVFLEKIPLANMLNEQESGRYMKYYYFNTLTRSPPFFVGMVYGYILYLGRNKRIVIPRTQILFLWTCAAVVSGTVIYTYHYQNNYSNKSQTANSMINAFIRPAWAMAIGWMILACTHGYGGPINWILASEKLKLISRLSYSMYLIHFPIISVYVGAALTPFHFDVLSWMYIFVSHFTISIVCGFIITVLVDSPASIFIKFLQAGPKQSTLITKSENLGNENSAKI